MATTIITNGTLIDPANNVDAARDLLIEDGVVRAVEKPGGLRGVDAPRIDARGLIVAPGLIDMHVHLREPGYEYKETVLTGTQSAVAGGFTSVACMANTNPINDSGAVTRYILERARAANLARVFPVGALSKGLKGEELAAIGEMLEAGAIAISDDGRPVMDANLMRRALEYCSMFNVPISVHEEDLQLAAGGVMNEGPTSLRLGLRGIPNAAEDVMVARDIALARLTGGRVHVAHLSTRGAVALVRQAKAEGLPITAEATPHHFSLTEEAVEGYNTNAKMAPPLRLAEDVQAVKEGLRDGTIDAIATDHAPHHRDEKEVEFDQAANGIVGLETALPLTLTLVESGVLSLTEAIRKLTVNPA
ncbi:MAG: dihydroorotase, partial [Deltaproteobacteria bacterium]|nr:dihydroorotase [Deltaproteobacteria bacterium]